MNSQIFSLLLISGDDLRDGVSALVSALLALRTGGGPLASMWLVRLMVKDRGMPRVGVIFFAVDWQCNVACTNPAKAAQNVGYLDAERVLRIAWRDTFRELKHMAEPLTGDSCFRLEKN